jgi:sialic acid synthase SpsE
MSNYIEIAGRLIGSDYVPLVIVEIGINHEGNFDKATQRWKMPTRPAVNALSFSRTS